MSDQTIRSKLQRLGVAVYENRLFRNLLVIISPISRIFVSLSNMLRRLIPFGRTIASAPVMKMEICGMRFHIDSSVFENAKKLEMKKNRIMSSVKSTVTKDKQDSALEYAFMEYAYHTNIIEGEDVTEQTVLGIRQAAEYVRENFKFGSWTKQSFLDTHSFIMGSKSKDYRDVDVCCRTVSGGLHIFPPFQKVPTLMGGFIRFMNEGVSDIHPVVRATLLKLMFVMIHPFHDGNGRVCRSILCGLLRQEGYPFITVSSVDVMKYKYFNTLEIYQDTSNVKPFFDYMFECIDQSLDQYAENLK